MKEGRKRIATEGLDEFETQVVEASFKAGLAEFGHKLVWSMPEYIVYEKLEENVTTIWQGCGGDDDREDYYVLDGWSYAFPLSGEYAYDDLRKGQSKFMVMFYCGENNTIYILKK